jgi:hypothetical protein
MIEHSCCCIWSFVLSGLNQIQIWFENHLKNGFEKLEKRKRKRIYFLTGPPSFLSQSSARQQRPSSSPPRARIPFGPSPASGLLSPTRTRAAVFRTVSLTRGSHWSVTRFHFPFFFLRPTPPSSFHRMRSIDSISNPFPSLVSDPSGL